MANFCGLERSDAEDKKKVLRMVKPIFHALARVSIILTLSWHSSSVEVADRNFDIMTGKLSKNMRSLNPAKPWDPKDFYSGIGYYTRNLGSYVLKPESLVLQQNNQWRIGHFSLFLGTLTIKLQVDLMTGSFPLTAS